MLVRLFRYKQAVPNQRGRRTPLNRPACLCCTAAPPRRARMRSRTAATSSGCRAGTPASACMAASSSGAQHVAGCAPLSGGRDARVALSMLCNLQNCCAAASQQLRCHVVDPLPFMQAAGGCGAGPAARHRRGRRPRSAAGGGGCRGGAGALLGRAEQCTQARRLAAPGGSAPCILYHVPVLHAIPNRRRVR